MPAAPAATGVAMLVPEEERKLSLLVSQKPSAAADWRLCPGASKNTPAVPASVGP